MKNLGAIFWKGLAALLPLILTLYALYWIVVTLETLLSRLVPESLYVPGAGLALGVLLAFGFGVLMHLFLFERLVNYGKGLLNRIPVVKSLYNALEDFFNYLGHRSTEDLSRVVLATVADGIQLIGFVTNAEFKTPGRAQADGGPKVAVYLPMSYQLGGFMVLLPPERLEPLDIGAEDAMRLVLTAGVQAPKG
ncbi:MAG: DUF502 domain-containing protein [Pseudomonadales bacterium]